MDFTKMHGLGNDFILLEDMDRAFDQQEGPKTARGLCHRRTGIGADGLIFVQKGEHAPLCMRLYNSDGSLAGMCGNGIRCFARYAYDRGLAQGLEFDVETGVGIKQASLSLDEGAR